MLVGVISTVFGFGGVGGAPTSCPQTAGAHTRTAANIQPAKRFDAIRIQNSPLPSENSGNCRVRSCTEGGALSIAGGENDAREISFGHRGRWGQRMLHAAPSPFIPQVYLLPTMRIGLVEPPDPLAGTQAGPASVVNVSLFENHPWIPIDFEVKNHEKNVNSCK